MNNTFSHWNDFLIQLINKADLKGVEAHYDGVVFYLPEGIDELNLDSIYPGKNTKMSSLTNSYFNRESLDRAKERLITKKCNSVNISLCGNEKNYTEQDHCMVSMVIIKKDKKSYHIEVFYRTTEICRKFLFDLKFLHDVILPYIGIEKYSIRFYFCNLTLSLIFLHTWFLMVDKFPSLNPEMKKFLKCYLQYLNKMLLIKERGSMLRSHWRHFQTFRTTETFSKLMAFLREIE